MHACYTPPPMPFKLRSDYKPQGDQPRAIAELTAGLKRGDRHQTLLGVTGSGKTFTVANVVSQVQRPTLVIAHNKTLAGQLYGEFKELFPENAVEFFVSYYDYYQPEAYVPSSDTYIEKDSSINGEIEKMSIFPSSHYVTSIDRRKVAVLAIREELQERLTQLRAQDKLLEAQRLEQRTMFDLEMIEQMGFCNGIENYSRHLSGRKAGEAPPCLLDYFPKDYLLVIDESHQSVPQIGAMYRGDRSRKETLVEYGFRLPSALDNRPLQFGEFERLVNQAVYVSATPSEYELQKSEGVIVEQIIRPTGLVDPEVEVRPVASQVDDLLEEVRKRAAKGERVLVTTLTKRMAEDLTEYFAELGVRVRYLHSEIETLERLALVRDLRRGLFDVLIGINLLREGLDIPEVSLVAVLDADKEGFLRSSVSLIQTIGRAARNVEARGILYADKVTDSMKNAL